MIRRKLILLLLILLAIGFLIPQNFSNPVNNSSSQDYNQKSFWYYPWGKSVTHKGIDIFARQGTTVNSSSHGIVLYTGTINMGGKIVIILGPKWRVHYYAHLQEIKTKAFSFVSNRNKIGTVGTTGNAAGKQPHLHYSIITIFPYLWRIDKARQGWKKMFYLDPTQYLNDL